MIAGSLVVMEQVSREALVVILAAALKGSLLVACVFVVLWFAKRVDARTRHVLWFLSIGGFLLLPVLLKVSVSQQGGRGDW